MHVQPVLFFKRIVSVWKGVGSLMSEPFGLCDTAACRHYLKTLAPGCISQSSLFYSFPKWGWGWQWWPLVHDSCTNPSLSQQRLAKQNNKIIPCSSLTSLFLLLNKLCLFLISAYSWALYLLLCVSSRQEVSSNALYSLSWKMSCTRPLLLLY